MTVTGHAGHGYEAVEEILTTLVGDGLETGAGSPSGRVARRSSTSAPAGATPH